MGGSAMKLASRFVEMGYHLPFSAAQLRRQAIVRFKSDMGDSGVAAADIPDQLFATPALTGSPLSIKALLDSWSHPGVEKWTEVRIANVGEDANESQGVTHNDKYWYFTQKNEIYARRLPLNPDSTVDRTRPWGNDGDKIFRDFLLGAQRVCIRAPQDHAAEPILVCTDPGKVIVGGCNYVHYGAPCYFEDAIYVPLEPEDKERNPVLVVAYAENLASFDRSLLLYYNPIIGRHEFQKQSGWLAINPLDRCIYTSMECNKMTGLGGGKRHMILVYSLDEMVEVSSLDLSDGDSEKWTHGFETTGLKAHAFRGFFPAAGFDHYEDRHWAADYVREDNYRRPKFPLDLISGGVFDAQGRLFLSIGEDYDKGSSKGRVCCYSGFDGMPLGCRVTGTGCSGWACEAEGLTLWHGELFLVTLHNGYDQDNMNFQVLSPAGFPAWTQR